MLIALAFAVVVEVRAALTWRPSSLVTYHKTGTVLAKGVIDDCFEGLGIQFEPEGDLRLPAVHFIRDPRALVRSALDYHRVAGKSEAWLHDRNRPKSWIENNHILRQTILPNESYQAYLNRVPFAFAIHAEFLRSARVLTTMQENVESCKRYPRFCMQVCLEEFTHSSESFQNTWSSILKFLSVTESHLECIKGHDLLNPKYTGFVDPHVTHPTRLHADRVEKYFAKFDKMYMNNFFLTAAEAWGCRQKSLRRVSYAALSMDESIAEQYA